MAARGNRRGRVGRGSRAAGAVEQVGRQAVDGGLVDRLETYGLVEAEGRQVGRGRLHVDGMDPELAGRGEDLADEESPVTLAAVVRGDVDSDQAEAAPAVAAAEP